MYPRLPIEGKNVSQDGDLLTELIEDAQDWAMANGFAMREHAKMTSSQTAMICPFTLFPTPFPRSAMEQAADVQRDMNELYFHVSNDGDLLRSALTDVLDGDEFTRRQMMLYEAVVDPVTKLPPQMMVLQIQRSDYMLHSVSGEKPVIKQIEVNNMASSFGGLSVKCTKLHNRTTMRALLAEGVPIDEIARMSHTQRVPNETVALVAGGLFDAWKAYECDEACVLFVVEEVSQNMIDQRSIEYALNDQHHVDVVRLTLAQCARCLSLDSQGRLMLNGSRPISVVYFRAGYVPQHYPTEVEWDARLTIEKSMAIKSPWIGLQLANTKKVQQVLADEATLGKYISRVPQVMATFARMWPLNAGETALIAQVRANVDGYVMKPQLEGGGANIYGSAIATALDTMTDAQLRAHIIMERVQPVVNDNYLIRAGQKEHPLVKTVSELGVYGYLLGDLKTKKIIRNARGGHVLRTKALGVDEGGIMAGASCIDSPMLIG